MHVRDTGGVTYEEFGRAYWQIWRDLVFRLSQHLDADGLLMAIADCRPEQGALWQGLQGDVAAQRDWLRYWLTDCYENASGQPWPILTDVPPAVPDDASALLG
jgi:hypothetical protein